MKHLTFFFSFLFLLFSLQVQGTTWITGKCEGLNYKDKKYEGEKWEECIAQGIIIRKCDACMDENLKVTAEEMKEILEKGGYFSEFLGADGTILEVGYITVDKINKLKEYLSSGEEFYDGKTKEEFHNIMNQIYNKETADCAVREIEADPRANWITNCNQGEVSGMGNLETSLPPTAETMEEVVTSDSDDVIAKTPEQEESNTLPPRLQRGNFGTSRPGAKSGQ